MIDRKLRCIANKQWGFFTAKQAVDCGYCKSLHNYHVGKGNWLKISRALYRLPKYQDSVESDFVRWTLWAAGQSDLRQITISHASALHYYGLWAKCPEIVELTVSSMKRNPVESGCRLYLDTLEPDEICAHEGFCMTTPARTLRDMQPDLSFNGCWLQVLELTISRGLITKEQAWKLDGKQGARSNLIQPVASAGMAYLPASSDVDYRGRGSTMQHTIFSGRKSDWGMPSRSFTLVEMLVVIAIISILAAMLMPALQKAATSAQTISCANNLCKISAALTVYSDDAYGYLPLPKDVWNRHVIWGGGNGSEGDTWGGSLPYLRAQNKPLYPYAEAALFLCPLTRSDWGGNSMGAKYGTDYILPYRHFQGVIPFCSDNKAVRIQKAGLGAPARKILITDSCWWFPETGSYGIALPNCHDRSAIAVGNVMFLDLHIKNNHQSLAPTAPYQNGYYGSDPLKTLTTAPSAEYF